MIWPNRHTWPDSDLNAEDFTGTASTEKILNLSAPCIPVWCICFPHPCWCLSRVHCPSRSHYTHVVPIPTGTSDSCQVYPRWPPRYIRGIATTPPPVCAAMQCKFFVPRDRVCVIQYSNSWHRKKAVLHLSNLTLLNAHNILTKTFFWNNIFLTFFLFFQTFFFFESNRWKRYPGKGTFVHSNRRFGSLVNIHELWNNFFM